MKSRNPIRLARHGVRLALPCLGLHVFGGCTLLPLSVQSTIASRQLSVPTEDLSTIARMAGIRHRMEVMWIQKSGTDRVEIGLGNLTPRIAVTYRRIDGRWIEDPTLEADWTYRPSLDLPPPPIPY